MNLPWAKRKHYHGVAMLTRLTTCAKCQHLLLIGHTTNKEVQVIDRSSGGTITHTEIYGKTCAPNYDLRDIAIDGEIRFYSKGKELISPTAPAEVD